MDDSPSESPSGAPSVSPFATPTVTHPPVPILYSPPFGRRLEQVTEPVSLVLYVCVAALFVVTVTVFCLQRNQWQSSNQPPVALQQSIDEWRQAQNVVSYRNRCWMYIANLLLLWCCYFALAATVLASFICDFVKDSNGDRYYGVWSYTDSSSSSSSQCRSYLWSDGRSFEGLPHVAASIFSVLAMLCGGVVVLAAFGAFCQGYYSDLQTSIIAYVSLLSSSSTAGIFVLAADKDSELSQGSIFGFVALGFGLVLHIGIYFLDRFSDTQPSNSSVERPRPATVQQNETRRTAGQRNNEENRPRPTSQSQDKARRTVERKKDKEKIPPNSTTDDDPNVRVWKDEKGRWKKSRRVEYRDAEGTKVVETHIETLKPLGSPLMSISEDDTGRLVKTIVTEYVDRLGEVMCDKAEEIVETPSRGDEENQNVSDEESKNEIGEE
mmetsp:Transcript_11858/g.22809  ORF Transcript_11858/g.22809 Transcript_11858/m.22809 type:complete len:438 (-) Transcript_11858:168-1481(-)